MTNFEKWKAELTIDALCKIIKCDTCPAFDFCDYDIRISYPVSYCIKQFREWANQEAT